MKHLTARPEVDTLPDPFGRVIRKALAKDPKDRYQTVDEMAEELLGVDEVRESLVGFDAMSLAEAVRRAVPEPGIPEQEPPSPPPPPSPAYAQPARGSGSTGLGGAFRDLADKAGDALKAAAAGVPVGTPVGKAPPLSAEAASGSVYYAGFWVRCGAALLDVLIVGVACRLMGFDRATGGVLLLYQAILIGTWNGQTLGKRACGIKIISTDGRHPTLGQSFGRALAKILNVFTLMIGYLMIPFDDQKRGLHDRIAGTLAVHAIQ